MNFWIGNSLCGRTTTARSGFCVCNSVRRDSKSSGSTTSLFNLKTSSLSMEIVWTCEGSTVCVASPLVGTTKLMLFSINGVVMIKMINRTNARSSSGVTLISVSVCNVCRSEKRRILFIDENRPERMVHVFVLELGANFRRKIVVLHNQGTNTRYQKVVPEHRGDGDQQSGHGGDQSTRNARSHRL